MPAVTLSVKKVRCRIILWQALLEREANADKIFKRLSDQGYKPDASVLINMVYTLSFMVVMPHLPKQIRQRKKFKSGQSRSLNESL
jgi:hypothetical protein